MSIPGISNITRVTATPAATTPDTSTATAQVRQNSAASLHEVEIDEVTQLPLPPRFPWLSRLSQELEHAARQKPAFAPAPILGDNVDRKV